MTAAAPITSTIVPSDDARRRSVARTALALGAVGILIALRCPAVVATPRLWAEEGSIFLPCAVEGFWSALFRPHLGYLNLATNVSTALASLAPLELVPTVTTAIAFLVQLSTSALALSMVSRATPTWLGALAIAAGVQLLSPGEIWLTSTNLHYWLGIAAYLVLRDEREAAGGRRWRARILLAVAALSGAQACFLTPMFAWRARRSGQRERWVQAGIMAAGAVVQIAVLAVSMLQGDPQLATRFVESGFSPSLAIGYHFVQPFFGHELMLSAPIASVDALFRDFATQQIGPGADSLLPISILVAMALTVVPCLLLFAVEMRDRDQREAWIAWPLVAVLSTAGSLHFASGFRYAFGPNVILLVLLVAGAQSQRRRWQRVLCALLAAAALTSNTVNYQQRVYQGPSLPRWRDEVEQWRRDPGHDLQIWPQGWSLRLPPR